MPEIIPIVLMSFNRPDYFARTLASLKAQKDTQLDDRPILLFQDGAVNSQSSRRYAEDEIIEKNVQIFRKFFPKGIIHESSRNLGVALNFERAEKTVFEEMDAEIAFFFEDDLELGPYYLKTMERLARLASRQDDIGYFAAYGDHRASLAEQSKNATGVQLMEHNWAFGLTQRQWRRSSKYVKQYLDLVRERDYRDRPIKPIMGLFHSWGCGAPGTSQDVAKTLACHITGGVKVNTFAVFGRYIGEHGLHSNTTIFNDMGFPNTQVIDHDVFHLEEITSSQIELIRERNAQYCRSEMPMPKESGTTVTGLASLSDLPEIIEYTGEFGPELVLFLPFCNWLSRAGLLKNRRIKTYSGMTCFYDHLGCEIERKTDRRMYVSAKERPSWWPVRNEHDFDKQGRSPLHLYPDFRDKFRKFPLDVDADLVQRPLLIVHNKHNNEWNRGSVNHISLPTLDVIFQVLKRDFTIVYIRHGMGKTDAGFVDDSKIEPLDDQAVLNRHPEVLSFDTLYATHRARGHSHDLNTFKNTLYSRCYRFISSQGGGAHQIALFSGSLLVVMHRAGSEERWAYGDGYYGFMAPVPPIRAICATDDDLVQSLSLFVNSKVAEDRILLDTGSEHRLIKLSPWTIAARLERLRSAEQLAAPALVSHEKPSMIPVHQRRCNHDLRDELIRKLWHATDPFAGVVVAPERVDVQGWRGSHHPWLSQAVTELRPSIIVEIGVWKGASTLHMAKALRDNNILGVVIAVDTWLGSSEHRINPDWFASLCLQKGQPTIQQTFMANVLFHGLQDYVIPLPLDSVNAAELLRTFHQAVDLIHIDAGHDYRSVMTDIEVWWPLLRPGGILIGDDYYPDGSLWPGVQTAFDAFISSQSLQSDHNLPKIRVYKPIPEAVQ